MGKAFEGFGLGFGFGYVFFQISFDPRRKDLLVNLDVVNAGEP